MVAFGKLPTSSVTSLVSLDDEVDVSSRYVMPTLVVETRVIQQALSWDGSESVMRRD
jgi:hypothetical protein